MNLSTVNRAYLVLKWSFITLLLSELTFIYMLVYSELDLYPILNITLFFIIFPMSVLFFLVSIGVLAKYCGRSWITWVGLTILSKSLGPIGPIIAYIKMRNIVKSWV